MSVAWRRRRRQWLALSRLSEWCEDCGSTEAGFWYDRRRARWKILVDHDPDCPALRSARSKRAASQHVAAKVGAVLFTPADYEMDAADTDIVVRHQSRLAG